MFWMLPDCVTLDVSPPILNVSQEIVICDTPLFANFKDRDFVFYHLYILCASLVSGVRLGSQCLLNE